MNQTAHKIREIAHMIARDASNVFSVRALALDLAELADAMDAQPAGVLVRPCPVPVYAIGRNI